ncbi:ISNCY family transposase [bacterium]|nr:ISNCY family transposase [bacterium]
MSAKELERSEYLRLWEKGAMRVDELARAMHLSERQVYRVIASYRKQGIQGLVHGSRGQPSHNVTDSRLKAKIQKLFERHYRDYGPTLLAEMLLKNHGIAISDETLRLWFTGKWVVTRKSRKHRKKRERRSALGEMVQFDGSDHDWFEGRSSLGCAFVAVDDATGRTFVHMARSENSEDAMRAFTRYCERYGIPGSVYLDRHKVYKAEKEGVHTDFSRALSQLGVKVIYAKSPQAKGRVERKNRTLQDRLVKAFRRNKISTTAQANRFLEETFLDELNARFCSTEGRRDVHRPLKGYDIKNIFCFEQERIVRNDHTIQFENRFIQLLESPTGLPRPQSGVILRQWLDGTLHVFYRDQEVKFKPLDEKPKPVTIVKPKPKADHPWRKYRIGKSTQRQVSWPWN